MAKKKIEEEVRSIVLYSEEQTTCGAFITARGGKAAGRGTSVPFEAAEDRSWLFIRAKVGALRDDRMGGGVRKERSGSLKQILHL